MADKKLKLQVITPNGIKLDKDVDMVIMRAQTGDIGILPGHETLSALLDIGALRIIIEGQNYELAVFGGLAEMRDNKLTIVTSLAEAPNEIDRERAEREMQAAEERISHGETETKEDVYSGPVRIRRSMVRLEVSTYPILSSGKFDD